MTRSISLCIAAAAAASFAFSPAASAQTLPNDYNFQWAPVSNLAQVALPGPFLFSFGGSIPPHQAGLGDAIRRCYSVDITQGGRNELGSYETTWFSFVRGWAPSSPTPGVNVGLLSIQSATESDLGGDACLSPWFSSVGNTGGHNVSIAAVLGPQPGTIGAAFPQVWQSVFQWSATSTSFQGVPGANTIGTDSLGLPLLANVIYEIQGPINAAAGNIQYYMGTTDEIVGTGSASTVAGRGTGGVTNGNSNWGISLFGVTADQSGATSHSRLFGFAPATGQSVSAPAFWGNSPGSAEFNDYVAFTEPFLWAENDGSIGSGGPDWNVSTGTPSNVQLWLKDIKSGAEGTSNLFWKTGGAGGFSASYDPTLLLNIGYFFWSTTPAVTMQQLPMSWDDLNGALPPKAGSYALNTPTSREGIQTLPVNLDPLTVAMLGQPGLSLGTTFTGADSVWYDAGLPGQQAIWEGLFAPVASGISKLSMAGGAAFPVVPVANPSLAGTNLGVAALSFQLRTDPVFGLRGEIAEVASALTVTLQ